VKVNYPTLLAGAAVVLLSAAATRADQSAATALATDAASAPPALATTASTAPAAAASGDTATYYQDSDPVRDFILRGGAWGVHASGSSEKVGEYQDLSSSPFADLEGVMSDGQRTVEFSGVMSDDETVDARLHYFGPHVEADVDYEHFLHQLGEHDYAGFGPGPHAIQQNPLNQVSNVNLFVNDNQTPGQDYAIRVQEFKANFKGNITENLKWRVNVFGIDKEGDRQANAFAHCYQDLGVPNPATTPATTLRDQCHVVSQSQHIDWQTTEVTPSLEWRLGNDTTVEYSHTIRAFTQNDQQVLGNWNDTPTFGYAPTAGGNGTAGYNIVPDSQTQIDRLKFSTMIGCNTDVYLLGYEGYNEDELRDTYRNFNGADLRITNRSIDRLALTFYGKYYREDTTTPVTSLDAAYPAMANYYREPDLSLIGPQINRETDAFGINGRWRPFQDECGTLLSRLSLVGGYEYSSLKRENAGDTFGTIVPPANGPFVVNDVFTQPSSNKNTFTVGVDEKWSPEFNTFLHYKFISTDYPLYGITPDVGQLDAALNSALPTQENRVELGCTWTPSDTLMVNATLYVENAMSDAPYVAWTSNSLPFTVSAWWAPTQQWSFSAGAAEMDSWINQNVNLSNLGANPGTVVPITPWQFTGVADVFNLGSRYQATEKLSFMGQFEYVHGINSSEAIVDSTKQQPATPPPYIATTYSLGQYSLVKMESFRLEAGADYRLAPRVTMYLRYNYYDYEDDSGLTSGQANMVLGGMSATF
jgi:hypothetical protein